MQQQFDDNYYSKHETDKSFLKHNHEDYFLTEEGDYTNDSNGYEEGGDWGGQGEEHDWGGYANGGEEGLTDDKQMHNAVEEYLNKMDYEDLVAGIPCRFKYRNVPPESFGLTTEELLLADDTELNKYVSLKKISTYRSGDKGMSDSQLAKKRKRLRALLRDRRDKEIDGNVSTDGNTEAIIHTEEIEVAASSASGSGMGKMKKVVMREKGGEGGAKKKRVRPRRKLGGERVIPSSEVQVTSDHTIENKTEPVSNDNDMSKANNGNNVNSQRGKKRHLIQRTATKAGDVAEDNSKRRLSLYN